MATRGRGTAIKVDDVSKAFKLPHEKQTSIKGLFVNIFRGRRTYESQRVLKNVCFEISKGEFFGIVGRNGSGKSTLLKLLAGIYTPDSGGIQVNGKLTPFIELGVGFNPELTGRENVFLNGALLGFDRKQMEAMYEDIVEFAELERFMDQKLKNYSSGMQVRLAFSIAIRADTDILLLDEVLAVGDEAFQRKCFNYFSELKKAGKTVVLVTHDMSSVQRFCTRALFLNEGKIERVGNSSEIAMLYSNLFAKETSLQLKAENESRVKETGDYRKVIIADACLLQEDHEVSIARAYIPFTITLVLQVAVEIQNIIVGINIINSQGSIMLATNTQLNQKPITLYPKKKNTVWFSIDNIFTEDSYSLNVAVAQKSVTEELLVQKADIFRFDIKGIKKHKHSLTHPNVKIGFRSGS